MEQASPVETDRNRKPGLTETAFLLLLVPITITLLRLFFPITRTANELNATSFADTAWMLTATALVLIMRPGLAFFYGAW